MVDIDNIKYVTVKDQGPRVYTNMDRLRSYMGFNPECLTVFLFQDQNWLYLLQWSPTFMQSCRQIYDEAGFDPNDLCSSRQFRFHEARALVSWMRILTPPQKSVVDDICLNTSNNDFNGLSIASAMVEPSGLRRLHLPFGIDDSIATELQAYCVYQHLRSVQVSEGLLFDVSEGDICTYHRFRPRPPADNQEDFAGATQARVRTLYNTLQRLPVTYPRGVESMWRAEENGGELEARGVGNLSLEA